MLSSRGMAKTQLVEEGQILWAPSERQAQACRIAHYLAFLARSRGLHFADYASAYRWSVSELGPFWTSIAEYFAVQFDAQAAAGPSGALPHAHWFSGATLNYAEHALR